MNSQCRDTYLTCGLGSPLRSKVTAVDRRMPQYVRWHVMHVAEPDIDIKTGKKAMIVGRRQTPAGS